jgi:hypothetical protein
MTDPVTNAEIEDVLSSIRRLVSSEHTGLRPASRVAERAGSDRTEKDATARESSLAEPTAPETDRLVLTPALRVPEDEVSMEEPAATSKDLLSDLDTPADAAPEARGLRYDSGLEQRIAELEAAIAHTEVADRDMPEPFGRENTLETYPPDEAVTANEAIAVGPDEPAESPFLADVIAAKAEDYKSSLWPEVSGDTPGPTAEHWPEDEGAPHDVTAARVDGASDPDDMEPATATERRESAFRSSRVELPEDDLSGWDTDEQGDEAPDRPEMHPKDEREGQPALDDAPLLLDEEVLRDLVAQMVRDELQGVLGEKITRNLRRLVRREIQRALAARDAE